MTLEPPPAPAPVMIPDPLPLPRSTPNETNLPQAHPARPSSRLALVGWALTVLLLAVLLYTAITHRTTIMHAWPSSERAYKMIGMAPT